MTEAELIASAMTERELDAHVKRLADDFGIAWSFHVYDSRRSQAGWVDWTFLGTRGALFRENKTESGRLTSEQRRVGYLLQALGLNWSTWQPSDLINGRIARELGEIA